MAPCGIGKKFIAELLGTFFLVFFGTGSAVITLMISESVNPNNVGIGILGGLGDWIAIALAFGLTVMVCIYLFGRISGAHLNPAVTIGLLVSKNISLADSVYYIVAQVIGACFGSLALFLQTIFAEFIGTFFLVLVIMGVAVDKKATPNFAGLSIGFTVTAVIIFLGPFTGGSINPARTFAPYLMDYLVGGINLWMYFPIYLIGPIAGAIAAALVYTYLAKDNDVCEIPGPFN